MGNDDGAAASDREGYGPRCAIMEGVGMNRGEDSIEIACRTT